MRAASLVDDAQVTTARAAEQYGVTVNQIGSILAWGKLRKLTQQEVQGLEKVKMSPFCILLGTLREIISISNFCNCPVFFSGDGDRK